MTLLSFDLEDLCIYFRYIILAIDWLSDYENTLYEDSWEITTVTLKNKNGNGQESKV